MKTSLLLLALAGAVPILAAIPSAEEECGELGVMLVPSGEDPSKYRRCRDHPSKLWKHNPDSKAKGPWHHSNLNPDDDEVVVHEMELSPRLLERPMPARVLEESNGPDSVNARLPRRPETLPKDDSKDALDGPSNIEDL